MTQLTNTAILSICFRWEPAPILVCVEDLTEDLDYVSKKCTSMTRVPYSLHFPLLSFTKQRGWTLFLSHPPSSSKCTFIHDFLQFTAPLALGLGLLANHGAELLYRNYCAPYTARVITLLLDHLV